MNYKGGKMEIWKDIKGFEGLYQISNYGRLKSFKVYPEGKILKLTNKNGDYFSVVLQGIGFKPRSIRIHRLVAEAFLPNPCNLPEINHIDGNKQNNHISNLEWVTKSQNVVHSMTMLHPHQNDGIKNYNKFIKTTPVMQLTKEGLPIKTYLNCKEASKQTGICHRDILLVANHQPKRKTAGGYKWEFVKKGVIVK
jgi:hypothetical protein